MSPGAVPGPGGLPLKSRSVLVLVALALAVPALAVPALGAPVTPTFALFKSPNAFGNDAGEPTVGITPSGAVLFQSYATTLKVSNWNDAVNPPKATWTQSVRTPNLGINVDPILYTDRATGRTFAGGLEGECSILSFTDNDGASWTPMVNACSSPAFDHPTVFSGAWKGGQPAYAAYERAVYYCAQYVIQQCALSTNGGLTFNPATIPSTACTSFVGKGRVAPDGTAFVPTNGCGYAGSVLVTENNGLTWTARRVLASGTDPESSFDPAVDTTPSSWVYMGYQDRANMMKATLSKDRGLTWSPVVNLSALGGIKTATMPSVAAGDDDRVAISFLGTTDAGNAFAEGFQGVWHLYTAVSYDGGATWTLIQVTTDPIQRGWICMSGLGCPDNGTRGRNLLEFFDSQVNPVDGKLYIGYADGCINACAGPTGTSAMSTSAKAHFARQSTGTCFLAARCG